MSLVFRDLADGKELGVFVTCVLFGTNRSQFYRISISQVDIEMDKHLITGKKRWNKSFSGPSGAEFHHIKLKKTLPVLVMY